MAAKFGLGSRSLEIRLLAIFAFISAILGWIGWASYSGNLRYHESELRVNRINEQLRALNRFMVALQNTETSQQGYLLTDKPEYLEPYEDALRAVHLELDRTQKLLSDEPGAEESLRQLIGMKEAKLEEMSNTILLNRNGRRDEALALVMTDTGKALMDGIRALVNGLLTSKRAEIAVIQENARQHYAASQSSLFVFIATIVTFMLIAYVVLFQDLTERRHLRQRLDASENTDSLTGLANFSYLNSALQNVLTHAYRDQVRAALILIDLDNFQSINDRYGFESGDRVLKETASRLRDMARRNDLLARLSGDVFVMAVAQVHDLQEIETLGERIVHTMTSPLLPEMHERYLGASLGIALYPDDALNPQQLLTKARQAMRLAKTEGKRRYRFVSDMTRPPLHKQASMLHALHRAVKQNEFSLYYQPQVDMRSGSIVGVEALLRWTDPERGAVPPEQFLSVAERSGLILPIGAQVLREACHQVAAWNRQGHSWRVSVNVSPEELASAHYPALVREALTASELDPSLLDLEITERTLLDEAAAENLRHIRALGVRLTLDDFGTGYSSLSYLARFPVHFIKIDKSFMGRLPHDKTYLALVRAIIQMAHALDIEVIAEGIENASQVAAMRSAQCLLGQGYHFHPPLSTESMKHAMQASYARER